MVDAFIQNVRFDEQGLIATIVQDAATGEIIALTHLDNTTLLKTLQTGQAEFIPTANASPDRKSYRLVDVQVNQDGGSLTALIEREPGAGEPEKKVGLLGDYREAQSRGEGGVSLVDVGSMEFGLAIDDLYTLISDRKQKRPEGSYTTYLFNNGLDKILKKVAEESGEVIIASKNKSSRELISELADLFYHLLVLMVERDITPGDLREELARRAKPKQQ